MTVTEIHGDADWNANMQRAGGKLVVVDFSATWCVCVLPCFSLYLSMCVWIKRAMYRLASTSLRLRVVTQWHLWVDDDH